MHAKIIYREFEQVNLIMTTVMLHTRSQEWSHLNLQWQSYVLDKKYSIKINQREIIQKRNKVELWVFCTAIRVIAKNMHSKFEVIWAFGDKVMLRTRNAL